MRCGFEGVSFSYMRDAKHGEGKEKQVLCRLDWALPEGGSLCLFGPSGCGKTTALRVLAGLEKPDDGRVVGMERRRITMLFQENRLLPWCTALENVLLGTGGARSGLARARSLLAAVGLPDEADRLPGALSGGMRRRVALARALARAGDVLLLDEPFKELDAAAALRIRALIREHANGKLMVLVTHDPQEAEALCDAVTLCSGPPLRLIGMHQPIA